MSYKLFDLSGKLALIAGGAGGIGSACAKIMAEAGARVVVADIDLARAEKIAQDIRETGGLALSIKLDITDYGEIEKVVEQLVREFGAIDILLNNVATTVRKPVLETTLDEWSQVIHTNLTAAFMLSQIVGREFIRQGHGKMIHIASTGGLRAGANFSAYGASKAGLIHLVKTLALEWATWKINVNAIAPTATETNFTADYYAEHPDKKAKTIENHPFKRLGQPEDYAGAALYLASAASDFVNGEVIVIDSGKTL